MEKYNSFVVRFIIVAIACSLFIHFMLKPADAPKPIEPTATWAFQSIDTMKYSRDLSREKINDPLFIQTINNQIKQIANTGATHVGIATPYDEEFLPILQLWVAAARANNLHVWFRGNFSGWEEWFEYPSITRAEHIDKTREFILNNPDLFVDGDVFTACPECENGGPGDPRTTGDVSGHRQFLIDEYKVTVQAFTTINKKVITNYLSMNADVARAVMDKKTTKAVGGVVTIDHYVASPTTMMKDIREIAKMSGGKIVIGEFGAPIPDLHGTMTQAEQATWINTVLELLAKEPEVIGVSYWVNIGGSTQLWDGNGNPTQAVKMITNSFKHLNPNAK